MSSTASKNKQRGRAFQAKLAQMSGGMNVGTLGGEDVMHDEFSYEAKTYHPQAKSNKGRDWVGEKWMTLADHNFQSLQKVMRVNHSEDEPLIMMRWHTWEKASALPARKYGWYDTEINLGRFKGRTYMKQAEANCPQGKIPVVVVHTIGHFHKFDVVLLYQLYWKSLLEKFSHNKS